MRVALALALVTASAWLLALVPPANAECFPRPDASTPFDIDWAFIATVRSVTLVHDDEVEAAGEGDGYRWTAVVDIDRVIEGSAEDPLTWRGHTLGHLSCGMDLRGENLAIGDRLFMAGEATSRRLLVWRREDRAWRFDTSLLRDSRPADETQSHWDRVAAKVAASRFDRQLERRGTRPRTAGRAVRPFHQLLAAGHLRRRTRPHLV